MAAETKKTEEKELKEKEGGGSFIENLRNYFADVRTELRKVSWPTREDVFNLTRIVTVVIIIASIVMGLLSGLLNFVINDTLVASFLANLGLSRVVLYIAIFAVIVGATWWVFRRDAQKGY